MIDFLIILLNTFFMALSSGKYYVAKNTKAATCVSKKSLLLKAGLELFAKKGLKGTTIRDIAKLSKVNSSMISYHFKNKEGLYRACLQDIGDNQLQFITHILKPAKNKKDYQKKLTELASEMLLVFSKEKYSGLLLIREFDRNQSPATDIFKKIFSSTFDQLLKFFKSAKKNKIIARDKDEFTMASFCLGLLFSQMRFDIIKQKIYNKSLQQSRQRNLFLKQFPLSLS